MKKATLIKSITELNNNIFRIENYLTIGSDEEYFEMIKYIKRGRNFICYKTEDGYHFAPSRFIGYKNNTLLKHENNRLDHKVDGRETDKVLNDLFKKCKADEEIENMYRKYCEDLGEDLGEEPEDRIHKFWIHTGEIAFDKTYREGDSKLRIHKRRERDSKLVRDAKKAFMEVHDGKLFCEICTFNFLEFYGKLGEGFIEAHHKKPLSERDGIYEIKIEDLLMVCPNCHRMLHKMPEMSHYLLKQIIEKMKRKYIC